MRLGIVVRVGVRMAGIAMGVGMGMSIMGMRIAMLLTRWFRTSIQTI